MTLADLAAVHIGQRLAVVGRVGVLLGYNHETITTRGKTEQATEYLLDVGKEVPLRGCYISTKPCSVIAGSQ